MRFTLRVYLICGLGAGVACGRPDERIDLTRYVAIDPGPATVGLAGRQAAMRVVVRNVAPAELSRLRLTVESPACTATVQPAQLPRLAPGQRATFAVTLRRDHARRARRYPLLLTLRADGLPVPAGLDLIVDLRGPADQEWIDVGRVKLVRRPGGRSGLYLLGAFPLLLVIGWLLWRISRRPRRPRDSPPDG